MSYMKTLCRTLCSINDTQESPSTELEFVDERFSKQASPSNIQQSGSFEKNNAVDLENVEIGDD
jgi:hypothetical protein